MDARAKLLILDAGRPAPARAQRADCLPLDQLGRRGRFHVRRAASTARFARFRVAQKDRPNKGVRLAAAVQPALIPSASLMAHAQGSQNIVTATGEFGGKMIFSGYGAGGDPTAVAVISDLYAIVAQLGRAAGSAAGRGGSSRFGQRRFHRAALFALRGARPAGNRRLASRRSSRSTKSASTRCCRNRASRIPRCRS